MALTPEQLAELQRLRQMFAPLAEQERRRQQAQWNAEQAAKKQGMAKGGHVPEHDLLSHPNKSQMIGAERVLHDSPELKITKAKNAHPKFNSYRYLSYHNDEPVGVLQFMTDGKSPKSAVIQNAYVKSDLQRQGIGSSLLARARQDFDLKHSDELSEAGKAFAAKTKAEGGSVSKNPFDYQNKKHLHEVAKHLVKLGKFPLPKGIGATGIMRDVLSSGKWQMLDDPRMHEAMRAAGHDSFYTQEKTGKQLNPIEGMKSGGKAGGDQYHELLKRHTKGERLSKAENELLGLYHRVGGGKKLRKPVQEYQFETAPNPKVNMAPEKIITPEDLVGGYGIPFIGDSSMAGRLLTGAEGHKFEQPVELEGGHDYMRANAMHADPLQRAIWASALAKINHLTKKAKRVSENGEPVYGIHTSMSPTGVDFSHMPAEVLAELVKNAKITKKAKAMFNKEMRAQHPDFPGVDHPELHEMLRAKGSGNLRKHFVERMATDPYQEAGFPEIAMARLAVQHPNLMKHDTPGKEFVGSSIGRFRPDFGQVERPTNPHHSYPNVIGGEYVGALHGEKERPLLTTTEFFPEFHRQRREFNAPASGDRRAFELAQPVQKFDQKWLDQVMPLYLARRKALVGKADGGPVDIAEIGVEEAPDLPVKAYSPFAFDGSQEMPFGGVDMDSKQAGQQLMSPEMAKASQQPPQQPMAPQGPAPAPQGGSNILQMTPQGKAMAAMKPPLTPAKSTPQPLGMKRGGKVTMPSTDGMRYAITVKSKKAK